MARSSIAPLLSLPILLPAGSPLSPVWAQDRPVAFVGATVFPVSGAPVKNGTVIILGGKIRSVGAGIAIPPNATRIDARGKVIIPGMIDASSSLFLSNEERTGGAADRDVTDGIDWFDEDAAKVVAQGVTTVYVSPGRRGSITGTGAIVKLRPSAGRAGLAHVIKSHAALNATLGVATNNRTSSLERLASYEALRSAFKAAQQYAESFARYDRDLKRYEAEQKQASAAVGDVGAGDLGFDDDPFGMGGFGQTPPRPQKPNKPRKVPSQEVLLTALRREIPVRIQAHRSDDVLNALRLADEFKLKLILERATEGYRVANEVVRRKVPVIWGPALVEGAPQIDTKEHWTGSAGSLAKAGVRLAISAGGETGLESRFLLENAAAACGYGLSRTEALRAITMGAAEVLGISDRCGSIAAGKDADLVILSGDPWNARTRVEQVWVDGEVVHRGH